MSGKYIAARNAFGLADLSWTKDRILGQLVSAEYFFNEQHQSADEIVGQVSGALELTGRTLIEGWASAGQMLFPQVKGETINGIVFFRAAGKKTALLIAYIDAVDGLPMVPNGGDVLIDVPVPGIFRI